MSEHDIMTVPEVAEYLRVAENTVRAVIKSGLLPAARIGKNFRIKRSDVENFLTNQMIVGEKSRE